MRGPGPAGEFSNRRVFDPARRPQTAGRAVGGFSTPPRQLLIVVWASAHVKDEAPQVRPRISFLPGLRPWSIASSHAQMDTLTRPERSERMGRILSKDTAPEMAVRRVVSSLGYRYRLHVTSLPGRPERSPQACDTRTPSAGTGPCLYFWTSSSFRMRSNTTDSAACAVLQHQSRRTEV